jgi:tRNA-uridine 2-sulfurtransferase
MSSHRGKVVVAMSGGVDSSVSACLLREQGYAVLGLFMRTGIEMPEGDSPCQTGATAAPGGPSAEVQLRPFRGCCSAADAADARSVAGRLGIPFFALNFKEPFERIIDYFVEEYVHGRTPNPCILCNDRLKFGRLAEYARANQADFIATGHYARIEQREGRHRLCRAVDRSKDQSYVLFGIDPAILPTTLFPVGGMVKEEVRGHARRFGLPLHDKPESQDICFVPDRDYARLVRERRPDAFIEGPIVDSHGRELGRHEGIANFTIGQRRGLHVAVGSPIYVIHIDAATNTVTVGPREELARDALDASQVRWLVDPPTTSLRAEVQIRYTHRAAAAVVDPVAADRVRVSFDEPQQAVTPGQAAVFYQGDVVLGGGWIDPE